MIIQKKEIINKNFFIIKQKGEFLKILIFFLFTTIVFASNILNINVLEHKNKIEVLFHFDTPYNGKIIQKVEKEKIKIILKGAKVFKPWLKKINTSFVYQVELLPRKEDSLLIIYTIEKVSILAAKSSDGFGMKIVVKKLNLDSKSSKKEIDDSLSYFLFIVGGAVIVAIFIFALFLFLPKTKRIKKKSLTIKNPKEKELNIRFEKPLDEHNKLTLISYKGVNYLVLIGNNNILLGKYKEDEIGNKEDFNRVVEENLDQIESFFSKKEENKNIDELDLYKEKASKEL